MTLVAVIGFIQIVGKNMIKIRAYLSNGALHYPVKPLCNSSRESSLITTEHANIDEWKTYL